MHKKVRRLVQTIQNCETTCEKMEDYVTKQCNYQARIRQLKLLKDCSAICALTAQFVARGSCFSKCIVQLCADICEACGKECNKFDDYESQNCAKICLNCAKECHQFAKDDSYMNYSQQYKN
jgi:hypothetical protein